MINNMEIKIVERNDVEKSYNKFILENFPSNEVKPLSHILRMMNEDHYMVLELVLGEKSVAAAFIAAGEGKNTYLLDYLAADKKLRSKGYGGILIRELHRFVDEKPILIETESLDSAENDSEREMRNRRNAFYLKNGALKTDVQTLIYGVEYDIWVLSERMLNNEETTKELITIYKNMVTPEKYKENVRIPVIK